MIKYAPFSSNEVPKKWASTKPFGFCRTPGGPSAPIAAVCDRLRAGPGGWFQWARALAVDVWRKNGVKQMGLIWCNGIYWDTGGWIYEYIYMNMIEYEYVYMNRFYDIDVMYIIHDDSYIHIILYSHIYIYMIWVLVWTQPKTLLVTSVHSKCQKPCENGSTPVIIWFNSFCCFSPKSCSPRLPEFFGENSLCLSLPHVIEVGFNGAKHAFTLAGANHLSKQALPVAHTCICCLIRQRPTGWIV